MPEHSLQAGQQGPVGIIDDQIRQTEEELLKLSARLEKLRRKKEILLQLPEVCPSCNGTGRERYTDEAGSGDWRECLTCKGLGRIGPLRCQSCERVIGTDMVYLRRRYSVLERPRCPWCGGALDYFEEAKREIRRVLGMREREEDE